MTPDLTTAELIEEARAEATRLKLQAMHTLFGTGDLNLKTATLIDRLASALSSPAPESVRVGEGGSDVASIPVSPQERHPTKATAELCDYFERQCNRFVNGSCTTVRCVYRGRAQRPGQASLLSPSQLSTCEEFETAHILAGLIGREYGPDYDIGDEARAEARAKAVIR